MSVRKWMRRDLQDLEVYQVQPVFGVKMDANESPFSLKREVREQLAQWILEEEDLQYYPDTDCIALRQRIAAYYGLCTEQVFCGVGSDQIIDCLSKAFLEEGDTILAPAPSFSMYGLTARINHGEAASFPLDENFEYDLSALMAAYEQKHPKLLYICSPNNPTGRLIKDSVLKQILDSVECIVVLDEAYGEFAGADHVGWLAEYPNLVILKTFSKSYGLAGLRVGYSLSSPEIREILDTVRAPYNLNTFSQMAACAILGRPEYEERARFLAEERARVYRGLKTLETVSDLKVYASDANFLFIDCGIEGVAERLKERGLLIRAYSGKMSQYIRMSVGTREENDRFLRAMQEILTAKEK